MAAPKCIKALQVLAGSIAALRRFIPQSSKKCLPMYEAIKQASKSNPVKWTKECEESLQQIKQFLTSPPIMVKPKSCEPLKLYISVADSTVAAVLIKEENSDQKPVYYASHILKDAETRYSNIEKLAYVFKIASRKLRQYFQGRMIIVMTNQPLQRILHKPDMSGRLASWTVELSQFNLKFQPKTSMRSQALADFITECTFLNLEPGEVLPTSESKVWILFTDGSSTSQAGGAGMVLTIPEGFVVKQAVKFKFPATNNEAKYEGLIVGPKLAHKQEAGVIDIFSDSQLVVKQVCGEFKAINDRMSTYMQITLRFLQRFTSWTINNIDRSTNQWAYTLSKMATSNIHQVADPTYFTELSRQSIEVHEVNCILNEEDWRIPIIKFIQGNLAEKWQSTVEENRNESQIILSH
ncbi:uncharacterized protein LOC141691656 [Apium graveolens]|uniref:uncharacterized protein LOC141691656 n=1 Tax=Apium graveolens TaxID=4045 RepID=UPI003D7BBCF7